MTGTLLAVKFSALASSGVCISFPWLPSHVGIAGNEEADTLAKAAHHSGATLTRAVAASDYSRPQLKQLLRAIHPDPRVAKGKGPKLLPESGLTRRDRATLLRLRTGCTWTAARLHAKGQLASPSCRRCGDPDTLEHLLCTCPALAQERSRVTRAYRLQGLPAGSLSDLLFPPHYHLPALHSLVEFMEVFLWLPRSAHGCSLPPTDYTSRPCTEAPTALCLHNHVRSTDASDFPPKAPPQEDNCAGLLKLDISFCARPRRITSSDGHKKMDRPASPFSGLGGTVRRTMLNFVFCFVQVFLWLPRSAHGCSLPPTDYTSRPCTEAPTALCLHNHVRSTDASDFPPKAPPQEDNCAGLLKLDISFCARPRRITSSDGHKKMDRPASPFSGLGGTVRRTMLNFVFCFVQVFLWLPRSAHGCSLPPTDYTSRPCTEAPTALCLHNHVRSTDASDFPPKAPPQEDNCAGLLKLDISFCARPRRITSSDGHKKMDRPASPFSGLGGTVRRTMLNFVFCFVQVGEKQFCSSPFRSNSVGLLVLPSPHCLFQCCVDLSRVIFVLLKLSGDIEENPGPDQDKLDAILSTVTAIKTSQHQLESGLLSVQVRLTEIETNLASLQLYNEKVLKCKEAINTMNREMARLSNKLEDLENRSRRNNLIIYGLKEGDNESPAILEKRVMHDIFKDILAVEVKSIERIHRIGKKRTARERPVILRFFDFTEKMSVLRNCSKLQGEQISISEDFSPAVREMRRKLWHSSQENRTRGDKVKLIFDKLRINSDLYAWDSTENKRTLVKRESRMAYENSHSSS
ncbi:uncharacterized protein LOC142586063 isoform X1 [Dermacentor variabilis]|uniref:uncharacterized protein LOC142586063 isoform X1 n=1 Tax=Dermacentor variabilis TaxID=34621 RepID=UPI003F5BF984